MELGLVFMGMDIWSMGYFGPFGEIRLNEGFPSFPFILWETYVCVCVCGFERSEERRSRREEPDKSCGNQRYHLRYNLLTSLSFLLVVL